MHAAVDFPPEQPRGFQDAKVLGNRRQGHFERLGQLGDLGFTKRQPRQDGPARGVRQGSESGVERRGVIVNHTV